MAKKPRINTGKKRKPMTLAHRKAIGRGLARVKGDTTDYDPYEKKGRKPGKASGKASGGASTSKRAKAAKRRTNGPKAVESVAAKKLPKNYVSGGGKQADPDFLNKDAIRNEPGYQDFLDMQREMVKASPEARAAFMNQVKQARKAAQIDHGPDPENGEYGRNRAAQRRALHLEAMAEDMGLIKAENTRRAQDQADAIDDRAEEAKKRNDQRRKQGMKDRKAARDRAEKQRAEREKRDQEAQRAAEREAQKATAAEREADREAARRAERDKQEQALERAASEKAAARRAEYANWDDDQLAEAHAAIMDKWDGDLDPANDENYDYSVIGQREHDRKLTADLLDEMDDRAAERAGYSDNRDYNTIAEKSQGHSATELGAAEQEYFDQIAGDRQAETELRDYLDQARQAHAARQAEYKAELDKLTPPEKGDRSDEAKAYRALKRKHDESRRLSNGAKKKHAALETRMRETYPDYDRPFYHTDHEELADLRDALDSVQDRDADTDQLLEQVQDELRYRHPDELDGWADLSIRDMTNLVKKYGHDLTETQIIDRMAMAGNDRERVMRESGAFQEAYGDWLRGIMSEYAKGWTHKGVVDEDPETFLHDLMYNNKNDGTNITAEQMLSNPMYARRASGEARRLFASLGFLPSRANFMRTLQGRAPKDYSEDRLSEITRKGGNATRRSKTRILLDDEISAAADARGLRGRARSQFMKEERQRRAQQNVENLRAQDEERRRNQAADKPADNTAQAADTPQATANTVTTEDGREIDMSTIPGAGKDTDKGMTDRVKAILEKQAAQRAESDTPESTAEKTARENGTTPNTKNVTKAVAKAEADKPAKRGRPKLNGPTLGEQRAEATREQTDRINELKANRPATGDPARAQWEYDMATARIQHAEAVERFERDRMASLAAQNKPLTSVKKNIDKAQAAQNKAREERDNALAKARKKHGDDAAETIRTTGGYVAPPKKKRTRKNNADTTGNNTETRAAKDTPKRDTWANRRANYTEKERAQLAELKDNRPSKKAKNRPQWEQDYAEAKRDLLARQVRFEEERRDELKRDGKSTKQAEKNLERLTGELKQAEVTAAEKKAKNAHKKWTAYPSFNKPDPDVHPNKAPREWKQWEVDRDEHRLEQEKLHLASEEALEDYSRKRGDERPYNADHARKELEEVRQRLEKNRRELEELNNAETAPTPANKVDVKPEDYEGKDTVLVWDGKRVHKFDAKNWNGKPTTKPLDRNSEAARAELDSMAKDYPNSSVIMAREQNTFGLSPEHRKEADEYNASVRQLLKDVQKNAEKRAAEVEEERRQKRFDQARKAHDEADARRAEAVERSRNVPPVDTSDLDLDTPLGQAERDYREADRAATVAEAMRDAIVAKGDQDTYQAHMAAADRGNNTPESRKYHRNRVQQTNKDAQDAEVRAEQSVKDAYAARDKARRARDEARRDAEAMADMSGNNGLQAATPETPATPDAPTTGETRDRTDNIVTFRRINKDEWGVTGTDLQVGDVVTARNRKGREKPVTITEIVTDTDGKQVARFEDNKARKRAAKRTSGKTANNAEKPARATQERAATPPTLSEGHDPYTGKPDERLRRAETPEELAKVKEYDEHYENRPNPIKVPQPKRKEWVDRYSELKRELKVMGVDPNRNDRTDKIDAAREAYKPTAAEKRQDSRGLYFNALGAWQTTAYHPKRTELSVNEDEQLFTFGKQEVLVPAGGITVQKNGKRVINGTDVKTGKPVKFKSDEFGQFDKPLIIRKRPGHTFGRYDKQPTPQNMHAMQDMETRYPLSDKWTPNTYDDADTLNKIKRTIAEEAINADPFMGKAPTVTDEQARAWALEKIKGNELKAHHNRQNQGAPARVHDSLMNGEYRNMAIPYNTSADSVLGPDGMYYTGERTVPRVYRGLSKPGEGLAKLKTALVDDPDVWLTTSVPGEGLKFVRPTKVEEFKYGYRVTATDENGKAHHVKIDPEDFNGTRKVWRPLRHENGDPYTRDEAAEYSSLKYEQDILPDVAQTNWPEGRIWQQKRDPELDAALDELHKRGGELNFDDADEVDGLPDTPAPAPQGKRHKKGTPFTTENLKEGETLDERGNIVRGDFKIISTGDGYRYMETGGNERMSKDFTSKSLDKMRKDVDALTARNPKPAAPSIDDVYRTWPDLKFQTDGNLRLMLEGEDDPERAAAIRAVLAARGGLA